MRNVPVRNRMSKLGLKSYCAIHDAVFEGGPEWNEPPATKLMNIACNPKVPYGSFAADGKPDWVQLPSGLWAMDFNGTDAYVNCGTHASLHPGTGSYSIEFWMKATTNQLAAVIGYYQNDYLYCLIEYYNDDVWLRMRSASSEDGNSPHKTIVTGRWYHFVGVRDKSAGTVSLYCDGELYGSPATDGTTDLTFTSWFGLGRNGVAWYLNGCLALPRIYPYARTAGQIREAFQDEREWFGV